MIAVLECETDRRKPAPERAVRVRLGSGSSNIRASCWEQATRLRRQLHHQGWICTSPSPNVGQGDFMFFVAKGPATVRRDLRSDLESLSEFDFVFEEIEASSANR
jgi:hypothetical protein